MLKRLFIVFIGPGFFLGGLLGVYFFAIDREEKVPLPSPNASSPSSQKSTLLGILRAAHGVDLATESAGLIKTINFTSGSYVKKGDIIITLTADAEIAKLKALQALADLAKTTYRRDKEQLSLEAVSRATLDVDRADLESKKAEVAEQEAMLARKIICAPFDGRLGISAVNLGQYLEVGTPIVTLQSLDPLYVDFYLPQQFFPYITLNQSIYFTVDAYPNSIFEGKVTTVSAKVNPATQNIQVEAILSNPEHKLLPGMSGLVELGEVSK